MLLLSLYAALVMSLHATLVVVCNSYHCMIVCLLHATCEVFVLCEKIWQQSAKIYELATLCFVPRVSDVGSQILDLGSRFSVLGFLMSDLGYLILDSCSRVSDLGFKRGKVPLRFVPGARSLCALCFVRCEARS